MDWGRLSIGQMTGMFKALREAQARGSDAVGMLRGEIQRAVPAAPRRQAAAAPIVEVVEESEEQAEIPEEEQPEVGGHESVLMPGYVAQRPDPSIPYRLPTYHPALTGNFDGPANTSGDERRIRAAGGDLTKVFN